jgi:Reverse transcriptase (RNA-dependent DNA polymerase).
MVTSGVPQGSILGPLLFKMYINDLPNGIHHEAIPVICTDDTRILLTAKNTEELEIKINFALDYMIDWFSVNG